MGQTHHLLSERALTLDSAKQIARLMGALGTASRVRILARLRDEPCTVGELTEAVEMEQPAVSHQLRILRDLGLVVGTRSGRHVVYGLHDTHVAALINEALRHMEHLQADGGGQRPQPDGGSPNAVTLTTDQQGDQP